MSLEKAIQHGKEHRRSYYGSKRFDRTCRNHGGKAGGRANQCPWCRRNFLYGSKHREPVIDIDNPSAMAYSCSRNRAPKAQ